MGLFHPKTILLGFVKVLWRINEIHNLEVLILIKRCTLLVHTCYDERSDFPHEVQNVLAYQHGLCMKKGCTFDASIKCSNGFKSSNEEQSEESILRQRILEDEGYIQKKLWRNKTQTLLWWIIHSLFFVKSFFYINFFIDTKLSKHLLNLERKD